MCLLEICWLFDSDVFVVFYGDLVVGSVDEVLLCYFGIFVMIYYWFVYELYGFGLLLFVWIIVE